MFFDSTRCSTDGAYVGLNVTMIDSLTARATCDVGPILAMPAIGTILAGARKKTDLASWCIHMTTTKITWQGQRRTWHCPTRTAFSLNAIPIPVAI